MSKEVEQLIISKFIGQILRVTTLNDRIFQGKLMCIDYKGNMILHESIAEIPKDQNCDLNFYINNYLDNKLQFQPKADLSEQQKKQSIKEYMGSHYYFGAIMITGQDVKKIEMLQSKLQGDESHQKKVKQIK